MVNARGCKGAGGVDLVDEIAVGEAAPHEDARLSVPAGGSDGHAQVFVRNVSKGLEGNGSSLAEYDVRGLKSRGAAHASRGGQFKQ